MKYENFRSSEEFEKFQQENEIVPFNHSWVEVKVPHYDSAGKLTFVPQIQLFVMYQDKPTS
jgi:hypothetical protein